MIGGGDAALRPNALREAGYTVFDHLPADPVLERAEPPVAVVLGEGHLPFRTDEPTPRERPTLAAMAFAALEALSSNPRGFLLIVEGAQINHAPHLNDFDQMLGEAVDFVTAVHATLNWRQARGADIMLVVTTADHETGGLAVSDESTGDALPAATWSTAGHTGRPRCPFSRSVPGRNSSRRRWTTPTFFCLLRGQ